MLERLVPLKFECPSSSRAPIGRRRGTCPVAEIRTRDGVLDRRPRSLRTSCLRSTSEARRIAPPVAAGLDYRRRPVRRVLRAGPNGTLIVNEMAPRPHNSGHWTIDAADVSQFELQVRTLASLPLDAARSIAP